jgi:hypothetical protein
VHHGGVPPKNHQSIVEQLDSIVRQAESGVASVRVLMTRCQAAIDRAASPSSAYAKAAVEVMESSAARIWQRDELVSIVTALRDDYAGGYMTTIEELVHASVFDDFIQMAEELVSKGYKDPAAVIGGSVLEEHLRKLTLRSGMQVHAPDGRPMTADRLNGNLGKASVYNQLEQKSVTAWLDLRNKAAHGHYEEYDEFQVGLMLQGVRNFTARYVA